MDGSADKCCITGSGTVRQVDDNGHGTHVLGSAAGNDETFGGMAPGADIIMVKSDFGTDDIINAMSFIDEKAAEFGEPYVINMSFGGHFGPHDGTDLLSLAIDDLTGSGKPGKVVVASAGNEGDELLHADGDVSLGTQTVNFTVTPDAEVVVLDVWYDGSDSFSFNFVAPNAQSFTNPVLPGESVFNCGVGFCIFVDHTITQSNNNSREIFFAVVPDAGSTISPTGTWSITLSGGVVSNGGFDAWIADCFPFNDCQFISSHGNTDSTVGKPGVARNAVTVGSYDTKECWNSQVGEKCYNPLPTLDDISFFSSKGPTRDGRMKPDIAAPGQAIVSTLSSDAFGFVPEELNSDGDHVTLRGTSMASPHVAGAVALLLAEDPTLDAAEIKAILQGDAIKDGFTGGSCNNTWGCGKLNIEAPVVVSLSKEANLSSVTVGDQVTYTLTAINEGSILAPGVTITDALPQGLDFVSSSCTYDSGTHTVTCSLSDVSGGATVVNTITVVPNAEGTITNDASVVSDGETLDTASVAITVNAIPPVVLSLTKGANPTSVLVGETATFSLNVSNDGAVDAPNVIITDVLPGGLEFKSASSDCHFDIGSNTVTCELGDISVGAFATSTIAVLPSAPGTFNNVASVASDGNTLDTANVSIVASPAVTLTMVADPATVFVGEPVTFALEALNVGASTSTAVTITDVLPENLEFSPASSGCDFDAVSPIVTCELGDLSVGGMATSTIVAIPSAPGPISNQATVTTDDPVPGSTHGSATADITATPAVTLSKVASPTSVNVGELVTFTLEVENIGLSTSTAVTIIDNLPPVLTFDSASPECKFNIASNTVTCELDDLSIGAMASSTIVVMPIGSGTIENEATVTSSDPIPGSTHSTANSSITVIAPPQQSISSSGGNGGGGARITPVIAFQPEGPIVFSATEDEGNPEPQEIRIWTSKNRSVLRFIVSSDVPWLKISPTEGLSDAVNDKERISLSVVTTGLKAGTHEGKVIISARKARNDPQEVPVTLTLEEPLPSDPSELAKVVEERSLEDAVETLEKIPISDAVDVFEELDGRRAASILSGLSGARAGTILGDITESKFTAILGASDVNELEDALSEMSAESFITASQRQGVRDTLLSKLPRVSAEQLFPVSSPQADPTVPLPVATQESDAVIRYDVATTSETGWTTLVGSPAPIERIVARFTRSLENTSVKVEILEQIPEELPGISSGQVVNALFSMDIDDAMPEDISVAHVTLAIEKDWIEVNEIHKWSIKLNRFDELLGEWVAFPTRRISEDADNILYAAAVPGFSVFAVTGSKELFEPALEVSDLRVIPTSPIEGQDVRVITTVKNDGVEDAVFPASLWVDGSLEDSEALVVGAGDTAELTFVLEKRVGKHEVRVDRMLGSFEVRPSVKLLEDTPIEFSTPAPSAAAAPTPTATALAVATPAPTTPIVTAVPQPTATARPQPTATSVATPAPALPRAPAPPSRPPVESGESSTTDGEGGISTATLIILIVVGIAVLGGAAVVGQGLRVRRREA